MRKRKMRKRAHSAKFFAESDSKTNDKDKRQKTKHVSSIFVKHVSCTSLFMRFLRFSKSIGQPFFLGKK